MTKPLCVVADVGGTNTRVALADGAALRPGSVARFRNADHADLGQVLAEYLARAGLGAVDAACAACAGPVRDGVARLTNLDWRIDAALLQGATGAGRVAILNDLQAQGHALGHIEAANLRPLIHGPQVPGAAMLVVGVGTGFNAAPVHDAGSARLVPPSESGHVNLPVATEQDFRLARFVEAQLGFASVEEVLSGRGIEMLYAFAAAEMREDLHLTAAEIPGAIAAGDPVACLAGRLFARMLGMVVGNLALTNLPFGGIYLIGGVARAMGGMLETAPDQIGAFAEAFAAKGRFSGFMQSFSVQLIEDDYAALIGCAAALDRTAA